MKDKSGKQDGIQDQRKNPVVQSNMSRTEYL